MSKSLSRRDFLKVSAIGAVGAAATALLSTPSSAQPKKLYTPGTYSASAFVDVTY